MKNRRARTTDNANSGGNAPLLTMEHVSCRRGGRWLFEALDICLAPGDALIVTGPNGVGKSSLLRIAAGLLQPVAGKVERASAGLVDSNLALDERMRLGAALGFWAHMDGGDSDVGIEAMGLAALVDAPVRILSAGQRKRAALARLISSKVKLWLLDEPGDGLDAEGQKRLYAAMAHHRASGGAILVATHQALDLDRAKTLVLA